VRREGNEEIIVGHSGTLISRCAVFCDFAVSAERAQVVTGYFGEYRGNSRNNQLSRALHKGMDYSTGSIVGLDLLSPDNSMITRYNVNHPIYGNGIALCFRGYVQFSQTRKESMYIRSRKRDLRYFLSHRKKTQRSLSSLISEFGDQYIEVTFDP
jgi:hypothetical protein